MQNWVSKKVPKNAEPDLVKGSPKVQRWAPKRARQPTMLVLTWTMYFSGPFLCTFYLTNTGMCTPSKESAWSSSSSCLSAM